MSTANKKNAQDDPAAHSAAADGQRLGRTRKRLLKWYDANARDLPWRHTQDPYAIWVSETMLQQTRVDTVIPYYERFLEHYPDVASLADADLESVYALWTGLGYYSRARNLREAAQSVMTDFDGELPGQAEDLRALKGIGRYTAGALASIAFDREEPLVDGNVIRVLARFLGIRDDVGKAAVVERFWSLAGGLVVGPRPGDLNQALMELGAVVCTPRSPTCDACPLGRDCSARAQGDPAQLPRKKKRTPVRRVEAAVAWIERGGRALAVRRPEGGLLGGLWELPGGELQNGEAPGDGLRRALAETVGLKLLGAEAVASVEHLFTHRRLRLHVFRAAGVEGRVRREGFAEHRWLGASALAALPQGGPTRKALAALGVGEARAPRARLRAAAESAR